MKNDGTVWAWGNSIDGQLGSNIQQHSKTPVQVKGFTNAIAISAGGNCSMAVKSDELNGTHKWSKGNF